MQFTNNLDKYKYSEVKLLWKDAWAAKENALRTRFIKSSEQLNQHSRHLEPMSVGDKCFVQNQSGNYPKRWDRSGTIVEVGPNDQYSIKIDGSGRITIRNRRFLRKFTPASTDVRPDPTRARSYLDPDTSTDINQDNISDGSALSDLVNFSQPDTGLDSTLPSDACPESLPTLQPLSTPEQCPSPTPLIVEQRQTPPSQAESRTSLATGNPRVPAALKRLMPHNKPGISENMKLPTQRGRKTRQNVHL